MRLSAEQKRIGMKYNILSTLSWDISEKRYIELQQLYEALNFSDNSKLVAKLSEVRNIGLNFTEVIYNDILLVVADYIMDRGDLIDLFERMYSNRFPHVIKAFKDIEGQYHKNGLITHAPKMKFSVCENHFFNFLMYRSDVFEEPDKVFKEFNYERDKYLLHYSFYMSDKNFIDSQFFFGNTKEESLRFEKDANGERVFESSHFQRYIGKRRVALAEYLGIEEGELAQYIHSEMKAQVDDKGMAAMRHGVVGTIETFTKNIIANSDGGTTWYNHMTGTYTKDDKLGSFNFVPDVNALIENYYKSYVTSRFLEEYEKGRGFNKLTLSRECIPESVEKDYTIILCMYEMQVLYKMFAIMQKQYYQDFSWEKITNQKLSVRYEEIIRNLREIIEEKEDKIKKVSHEKEILSLQITADASKQTAPLVVENNKMMKQLEEKDAIIEELKKRLQYQSDLIDALNVPEEEKEDNTYDLSLLQAKRYLFVGRISDILPELKHKFPNSLFMETEGFNLSGIEIDAIVMLIKGMSHSMFYKIKSTGSLVGVKNVMCNTRNIDTILQRMHEETINL